MLDTKTLFQESYYLAKNPEIADAVAKGIFQNGFEHFTKFGQFEGRNPSALFDTNYYLANNPDVAAAVNSKSTTALQHFIKFGEAEGRNPSPFYNNSYYLGKNPDVAAAQDGPGQPQIPTDVIDVMTSPVGIQLNIGQGPFAAPFGPATVAFTPTSLLPQSEKDRYNSLPTREEKDAFVRNILDKRTAPLGYDPVGLEGSGIDARLIQGQYLGVHTYGWNEFEIAPGSQELKVTTYGVEPYTQSQLDANPSAIINRKPFIVSQFVVNPK